MPVEWLLPRAVRQVHDAGKAGPRRTCGVECEIATYTASIHIISYDGYI
jgi:hypothetical protein